MSRTISYIKLVLFFQLTFFAMTLNAQDLQKHRWEKRILIVKTTDKNSEHYQQQLKLFAENKNGLIDRKLVLYKIVNDKYLFIDYAYFNSKSGFISEEFKSKYILDQSKFEIILLGLDGGIKLRQSNVLRIDKLYNIIDAMPMRQNEMRRN